MFDSEELTADEFKKEVSKKDKLIKEAKSITLILLAVLTFRSMIAEPFRIPSGSMIPTLMIGDFILVNKLSYGVKVPFTDINLFGFDSDPIYLFGKSDPKRGDVIVFKYPRDRSINYIKRVVAVPGDTVEVRSKILYVNDQPQVMEESKDNKKFLDEMDDKFKTYNFNFFKAKTGEADHILQFDRDAFYSTDFEKRTIGPNEFFVMGDNRDYSSDSRFWGTVPRENIKGRAMFVWFSLIFPLGEYPFKFRPFRIGTVIN